jgi:hypothetical protein
LLTFLTVVLQVSNPVIVFCPGLNGIRTPIWKE